MATVLVTGATGRIGSALLPLLVERDHRVLAVTRRAEAAPGLAAGGATPIVADIASPDTLRGDLGEADVVFLATADAPDQDVVEIGLIDAAAAAGRPFVVKLSAQSAGLTPPRSFGRFHRRAELALAASGLDHTILRPTFFQQSLLLFAPDIAARKRFVAPAGRGRIAMVDLEDVARAAAAAIGDRSHAGRTYTLTGPSARSMQDVAEKLSSLLGARIGYTSPPGFVARLVLPFATGMPRWKSNLVVDLFAALKAGAQQDVSADLETLTGRPGTSLDAFLEQHVEAFRPSAETL
ncbi:NAD(P)H-binding protein [Microbaculum marinum]|uniref:NAD(P)H-binding protein n=1 Tax=Microbaculum marinum TaxID=1764581 RepID=A0AAW9RMB0_9HYPH